MPFKDYYQILGVLPGASTAQIKKAFRKLAMQYHPDKLDTAQADSSTFREIQEAYETLTNPIKRERYLYERWLQQTMGKSMESSLSAADILKLFITTEQYLSNSDKFRLNSYALFHQLTFIFDKNRINTVIQSNNSELIFSCSHIALRIGSMLNSETQLLFKEHLRELICTNESFENDWQTLVNNTIQKEKRETYSTLFILLATVLICLLFFYLSKS